jgi:signal peptide peptidase SppA
MDARFMQRMQLQAAGLSPDAVDDYVTSMIAEWLEMDSKPLDYTEDGIAIVSITGPLYKRKSPFQSNYRSIGEALDVLLSQIPRAVVLKMDTPGGMVDGLESVVRKVEQLAQQTLVVVSCQGMLCSAGYRIAAMAGTIFATEDSEAGSIGTYWQFIDYSAAFAEAGLRSVMLTTGPFKGIGAIGEPINDEQRAFLQDLTDKTNQAILQDVKNGRGFTDEQLASVSDGRFWLASDALSLGLIDKIGSMSDVLAAIRSQTKEPTTMSKIKLEENGGSASSTQESAEAPTIETAPEIGGTGQETTTPAPRSLADFMAAFGDADGARMFRDGIDWDTAQSQYVTTLKGQLQDTLAENAQLKARLSELGKAMLGETEAVNIGQGEKKKSLSEAFRRGPNNKR